MGHISTETYFLICLEANRLSFFYLNLLKFDTVALTTSIGGAIYSIRG
jgi:hypothetical protein